MKSPSRAEDKPPAQGPSLSVKSPLSHSHPDDGSLLWLRPASTEDRSTLTPWGGDTTGNLQVTVGSVRVEKSRRQKLKRPDAWIKMLKITGKRSFSRDGFKTKTDANP